MTDPVQLLAKLILSLNAAQLQQLRELLEGGDPAGVGAVIPPDLPLKEDGAELPFEDWPPEYWENQA